MACASHFLHDEQEHYSGDSCAESGHIPLEYIYFGCSHEELGTVCVIYHVRFWALLGFNRSQTMAINANAMILVHSLTDYKTVVP